MSDPFALQRNRVLVDEIRPERDAPAVIPAAEAA